MEDIQDLAVAELQLAPAADMLAVLAADIRVADMRVAPAVGCPATTNTSLTEN